MRILLSFAVLAMPLYAASTTAWELNTFADFVRGKFSGVALTRDGRLERAPGMKLLYNPEESAIWSVAVASNGRTYLGTGPRGKLFEVDAAGQGKLLFTAPQPMIFAVAAAANGVVYAATSPDGRVYRIENGRATEYYHPQAKYIWALAVAPDGRLFVATGDQGKIHVVTNGRGEVYYDTGQTHVTALAIDAQGRLLAGSEPNGIVYRITAKDKAFVLYDAALPEIRSLAVAADGSLYVAALGGSLAKKTAAAANPNAPAVAGAPISITVTDDAQAGLDLKPREAKPATATPAVTSTLLPTVEYAGVEKSAIYRILPDNTVETLWTSKEENVYDLLERDGALWFATDLQGRIYRRASGQVSLMAQTEQGETTRLFSVSGGLLAATANRGQLFRLTAEPVAQGQYESPVHDANTVAKWGRLMLSGASPRLEMRAGNTTRPDRTWSDWEAVPASGKPASPAARYAQWRAAIVDPIDSAKLLYLPQNTPPLVKSITVVGQTVAAQNATKPAAAAPAATAAYTLTVTDTGETGPAASTGTPAQTILRSSTRQLVIVWQGEDPDGDSLTYQLSYRGEGESRWKLLKANTTELAFTVDADLFADGRYWFRVSASDKLANAGDAAREAELVSSPVLIDNTPPVITELKATARTEYTVSAQDNLSELRRCEYSLDAGPWNLLEAEDGVTDSLTETFKLKLPSLAAGEHTLSFRLTDAAGNVSAKKLLVN
ncbi:MAG: hypothetical protein K2X03_04580 [Bryobacteraceae bacterium]|nr:hypothetical protein [Bryobacteraceae bacterium]